MECLAYNSITKFMLISMTDLYAIMTRNGHGFFTRRYVALTAHRSLHKARHGEVTDSRYAWQRVIRGIVVRYHL